VGNFTVRHDAIRLTDDGQKQMITAHMTVFEHGEEVGAVTPAKWFYRKRTEEPTTEVAIRRTFAEDLYVVLAGFDLQQQSATFHVVVNPLVNWIWAGFAILAIGTIIALLPERAFASATSTVPSRAATTSLLVLVGLVVASGHLHAQHVETPGLVLRAPSSVLERELQGEIVCMCGTCGRKRIGECTCGMAAEMRAELAGLVAKGMDRDQVYQYYIDKYGSQEPLAMPIDKGFNRLAWAVPYALGLFGAAFAGALALRWSRTRAADGQGAAPASTTAHNGEWDARLDEELRDLD
jgi:cytochrome c-type biogenesis protein CcmF